MATRVKEWLTGFWARDDCSSDGIVVAAVTSFVESIRVKRFTTKARFTKEASGMHIIGIIVATGKFKAFA